MREDPLEYDCFLGRGSFGVVVRAVLSTNKRTREGEEVRQRCWVAVKEVDVLSYKASDAYKPCLLDTIYEMRLLAHFHHLQHSHVLGLKGVVRRRVRNLPEPGKTLCLVMPYYPLNLEDAICDDELLLPSLNTKGPELLLKDILKGLAALHDLEVAHRDLKPANILLKQPRADNDSDWPAGWIAVIGDLGSARSVRTSVRDDRSPTPPKSYAVCTAGWRAPELLCGFPWGADRGQDRSLVDLRVDVWSVGLIFYEMFAGDAVCRECSGRSEQEVSERVLECLLRHPLVRDANPTLKSQGFFGQLPAGTKQLCSGFWSRPSKAATRPAAREEAWKKQYNAEPIKSLLWGLLRLSPGDRWTARRALEHLSAPGSVDPSQLPSQPFDCSFEQWDITRCEDYIFTTKGDRLHSDLPRSAPAPAPAHPAADGDGSYRSCGASAPLEAEEAEKYRCCSADAAVSSTPSQPGSDTSSDARSMSISWLAEGSPISGTANLEMEELDEDLLARIAAREPWPGRGGFGC